MDHARHLRGAAVGVHYLWLPRVRRIYLLFVYGKDEAATLTRGQKQALAAMSRAIKLAAGEEDG